jgi:hypothetical protein
MSDSDIPFEPEDERDVLAEDDVEAPDEDRPVVLEDEDLIDGPPPTIDPDERIEVQRQLDRERRFDAFEQGLEG